MKLLDIRLSSQEYSLHFSMQRLCMDLTLMGRKCLRSFLLIMRFEMHLLLLVFIISCSSTKDVVYIILAYFLSNTLISTIRFILLARTLPAEDTQTHTTSISLGKHLSFMDFLSNVSMYIDKILIFQFLGATPLALYALALAPIKQLQSISKIIRSLVLPKFSARSGRELKKTMHIKIKIFYLVSITAAILYCVFDNYSLLRFSHNIMKHLYIHKSYRSG